MTIGEDVDELPPDAYSDRAWTDLFPWLAQYLPGGATELSDASPAVDWWLNESPAVTSIATGFAAARRAVARVAISDLPSMRINEFAPHFPRPTAAAAQRPSNRVMTTLGRLGVDDLADLGGYTLGDLLEVRGTGLDTVLELLELLITIAALRASDATRHSGTLTPPRVRGDDRPSGRPSGAEDTSDARADRTTGLGLRSPVEEQLLDDLRSLARWRSLRAEATLPLIGVLPLENHAPESMQNVAQRIASITPADLAGPAPFNDPLQDLTEILSSLSEPQLFVTRERFAAVEPRSLADIGAELGVSRERIRQLEDAARTKLTTALHKSQVLEGMLASIRVEIQLVCPLDRLISRHPELGLTVRELGVPLWLVLDRLDDYFEVSDGWAAAPSVTHALDETRTLLSEIEDEDGVADARTFAERVKLTDHEVVRWLTLFNYQVLEEKILVRTSNVTDHAVGILSVVGRPMEVDEIAATMVPARNVRTIVNALGSDPRLTRSDRSAWSLSRWDLPAYTSIRKQIGQAVDAAGGDIPLADLVTTLTSSFDVSAASVQTYASSGEFSVEQGQVRRRRTALTPGKIPEKTRRVFKHADRWSYRLSVTRDHLRGSGFSLPTGVASLAGCKPGETVELSSRLGPQAFRWTRNQPSCGTIRRFLEQLKATEDQDIFLEFYSDRRFNVSVGTTPSPLSPLEKALALTGAGPSDGENPYVLLATALGLERDAPARRILRAFRERGDEDIADLLEQAWVKQR